MPQEPTKLLVHPNPFGHLDHKGRPNCALPLEPTKHTKSIGFVGARIKATEIAPAEVMTGVSRGKAVTMVIAPAKHEHFFEYQAEPVVVPNTPYYRKALRAGELVAADVATTVASGLSEKHHTDPKVMLDALRAKAIDHHVAHHGETPKACVDFVMGAPPKKDEPPKKDGPVPAAPAASTPSPSLAPAAIAASKESK